MGYHASDGYLVAEYDSREHLLKGRVGRLPRTHCPRCQRLQHDNESLRILVDLMIATICDFKRGDCDPDALAGGFDETA